MKRTFLVCCLTILAAPAFGQNQPSAGTEGSASEGERPQAEARRTEANAQGEQQVCRSIRVESYSHMSTRRVCHTRQEWRTIDQQAGE